MASNLLQLERLVRRLVSTLKGKGNAPEEGQMAQDYSAACEDANRRLQQCENIIRNGDVGQAIQLAEAAPNLLDVVTVLAFGEVEDWRARCEENHLTVAPAIDERSVRRLNECYGKGIKPDSHLYARYRSAILKHDDEKAFEVIRCIARVNSEDKGAETELARMDARVLGQYMERLSEALESRDELWVVDLVERIEAARFRTRPPSVTWLAGQRIRCGRLLKEAEELRDQGDWASTDTAVANLETIFDENEFDPLQNCDGRLSNLQAWLQEQEQSAQQEKNQGFRIGNLRREIANLSSSEAAIPNMSEAEVVELQNAFEEQISNVSAGGIKVSREQLDEVVRWREVLESQIGRWRRRRRIRNGLLVASVVLVLAIGIASMVLHGKVSVALNQLAEHREYGEFSLGSQLRKQIETSLSGQLFAFVTADEFSKWDAKVGKSSAELDRYQTARDAFAKRITEDVGLDEMAWLITGFNLLNNQYTALAPEYQKAEAATFKELRTGFLHLQDQNAETVHAALGVAAGELDTILDQFRLDSPVALIEKGLVRVGEKVVLVKELIAMVDRSL